MTEELQQIWERVQGQLATAVDEGTYRMWLAPLTALELSGDGRLTIAASPRACHWIADRFGRLLQTCAAAEFGPETIIDLVSFEQPSSRATCLRDGRVATSRDDQGAAARHADGRRRGGANGARPTPLDSLPPAREPSLNPKLTFEQFVIGDGNRLAHAAALAVAENPCDAYNPLFLCGPPGLGKTHLLRAIATFLLRHSHGLTVRYTTGETFTTEFLTALKRSELHDFKNRFRRVDVLLVDDIQFLERKTRTEEEFFHTFNALSDIGSQLVVTSDRPPHDLEALEERLRDRFEAGLVADIRRPDLATRMAILRKRVTQDNIPLADSEALHALAQRVTVNVRALEGALVRSVAYASLTARPLGVDLVNDMLDQLYPRIRPSQRSLDDIQTAICAHFHLTAEELQSRSRVARVAWPRQVAMYLAREVTDESLPSIGRHFGGRDHTTVLHACKRASERIAGDDMARRSVNDLLGTLRTNEHDRGN